MKYLLLLTMRLFLFACSFLFSCISGAQSFTTLLNGKLTMETGEVFTYRLELTERNGGITGYAYTFDSPFDTKTVITGQLDKQRGLMSFKETEVVYSHSRPTKAFMCLISGKLAMKQGILSGAVQSQQLDNTSCSAGRLVFTAEVKNQELFGSHDQYDMAVEMGGKKAATAIPQQVAAQGEAVEKATEQITEGVDRSYEWRSDSIKLEVWDGGVLDQDVIRLTFDGKEILPDYTLTSSKKTIYIALSDNKTHNLAVVAVSEGREPPATATMALYDGGTKYNIIAYNKKGAVSMIRVRKVSRQ